MLVFYPAFGLFHGRAVRYDMSIVSLRGYAWTMDIVCRNVQIRDADKQSYSIKRRSNLVLTFAGAPRFLRLHHGRTIRNDVSFVTLGAERSCRGEFSESRRAGPMQKPEYTGNKQPPQRSPSRLDAEFARPPATRQASR